MRYLRHHTGIQDLTRDVPCCGDTPLSWHKHQLNQVILMHRENVEAFVQAFSVGLRKPRLEVLGCEIRSIVRRTTQSMELLDEWASNESVLVLDSQKSWSPTILKHPKGVILIVSCVSIVSSILHLSAVTYVTHV